ncbi:lipoprotein [Dysosmobacter sp.]
MKRLFSFLLIAVLLTGCAQTAPKRAPVTGQMVLDAYAEAASVYDWFDLCSLPTGSEPLTEDGTPWDPSSDALPYYPVEYEGVETYAGLESRVRACFAPALADAILENSVNYRDINGKLYCAGGARGSNLCFLDKTVAAEQMDDCRWTVTLTFWADWSDQEIQADGHPHTVATTGYSQTVLDYEQTPEGWRFTSFCPSDALDLDADTVFAINYYQDFEATAVYQDYSDWQLVCCLIHADGAYAEGPSDLLLHRFLERPEDILQVLALLDGAPYKNAYSHIDGIVAGPGYAAAGWLYREDEAAFQQILDTCRPETAAEQSVLDKIRTAYLSASAGAEPSPIEIEFSLIVPGSQRVLTLGAQKGTFPWGYDLKGNLIYTGSGDTYGTVYELDCGDIQLAYSVSPDDGTEYLYRFSTAAHYDQSQGYFCTPRGFYCGYDEAHLMHSYSSAVKLDAFQDDAYDACYVYEPGGMAFCKHIAFFISGGVVAEIEMEDLMDGRLLEE